jgi:hypothetical protein
VFAQPCELRCCCVTIASRARRPREQKRLFGTRAPERRLEKLSPPRRELGRLFEHSHEIMNFGQIVDGNSLEHDAALFARQRFRGMSVGQRIGEAAHLRP